MSDCTNGTSFQLTIKTNLEPWQVLVRRALIVTSGASEHCVLDDPSLAIALTGSDVVIPNIDGHSVPWVTPGGTINQVEIRVSAQTAAGFSFAEAAEQTVPYGLGVLSNSATWTVAVDGPFQASAPFDSDEGSVATTDSGGSPIDISSPLASGTSVTFTATPASGWAFDSWAVTVAPVDGVNIWNGDDDTNAVKTVSMNRNWVLTPVFKPILTVTKSGSGDGTVASTSLDCDVQTGAADVSLTTTLAVTPTSSFDVSGQETSANGMYFKPDGLKMYVIGAAGDDVNEYDLSVAWDVTSAVFLQLKSISSQDNNPQDIFFRADGLKMYMIGGQNDRVYEYDLSPAWDVSTLSFLQHKTISSQDTSPQDVFFKPDGLKMYVVGNAGQDINEYDLSPAWDVTTASFLQLFDVSGQETTPTGMFLKSDGLEMFVIGLDTNRVYRYLLSAAWDITSAVFSQFIDISVEEDIPTGVFFKSDMGTMFVVGKDAPASVNEYSVGFSAGPSIVNGVGTLFTSEFSPGDGICLNGVIKVVDSITDNTELLVTVAYTTAVSNVLVEKQVPQAQIDCGSTCTFAFAKGTVVALTATPDATSDFTTWAGDAGGATSPVNVTLSEPRTVDAEFTSTSTGAPTSPGLGACEPIGASPGLDSCSAVPASSGLDSCSAVPASSGLSACAAAPTSSGLAECAAVPASPGLEECS